MSYDFKIIKNSNPKPKPEDVFHIDFGTYFSDHMFVMDYNPEKGWHDGRIVPYEDLKLSPAAFVLHYGQESFEGLKSYRTDDGRVALFRPDMNARRLNRSNDRVCIPQIPEDLIVEAIKAFVEVDQDWIPTEPDTSFYIRPFIIATEPFIAVRPSREYQFIIIGCPVGPYYPEGLAPTKIYVEDHYVRATPGGTGYAKVGGNYAAGLKAQEVAHEKGYSQILWLDGVERKYVEEIGTSNAFFVIDGELLTAIPTGSILEGITRDSVIQVAKSWGMKVTERRITMEEIYRAHQEGRLQECFASGTAAVISPVGELGWQDKKMVINNGEIGEISQKVYDTITGIQSGKLPDSFGWVTFLEDK